MKKSNIIFIIALITVLIILNFSGLGFDTWQYWVIGGLVIVCRISGYEARIENEREYREFRERYQKDGRLR